MYCVIQEVEQKKNNKNGYPKELISEFMKISINGIDMGHYTYHYSQERFERSIKKAYKISIHKSYRENGKPRKKQFVLCTVSYYELATDWFSLYDYCDSKIIEVAKELDIDTGQIYDIVENKLEPLIENIQGEFQQTKEYKIHVCKRQQRQTKGYWSCENMITGTGIIKELNIKGYGYIIQDSGGQDLYFHSRDLMNGRFDYLKEGIKVTYIEKETANGPRAKCVTIADRKNNSRKLRYI